MKTFIWFFCQPEISLLCPPPLVSPNTGHLLFNLSREHTSSFLWVCWWVEKDVYHLAIWHEASSYLSDCQYINFQYYLSCTPFPPCSTWCFKVTMLSGVHSSHLLGILFWGNFLVASSSLLKEELFLHLLSVF